MPKAICSDDDFIKLFLALGPKGTSKVLRCTVRAVFSRREALEARGGFKLESPIGPGNVKKQPPGRGKHRVEWTIKDGYVQIGGDAHVWPGAETTAMRAFVKFAKKLSPRGLILNGDIFDGATISRHARIMWEQSPTVNEELEATHNWLNRLVLAAPADTLMAWPEGNHDARFESRLSERAPEYANVKGVHLKDHFSSRLLPCWDVWINNSIVVQHRGNSGGENGSLNNTIKSGKTFISNHHHSAQVRPFTDLNGTRWGVDTGCLADPWGPQFRSYTENRYRNHRSAFCVLKFIDGQLMEPQLVLVWDEDHVQWRGELIRV